MVRAPAPAPSSGRLPQHIAPMNNLGISWFVGAFYFLFFARALSLAPNERVGAARFATTVNFFGRDSGRCGGKDDD